MLGSQVFFVHAPELRASGRGSPSGDTYFRHGSLCNADSWPTTTEAHYRCIIIVECSSTCSADGVTNPNTTRVVLIDMESNKMIAYVGMFQRGVRRDVVSVWGSIHVLGNDGTVGIFTRMY